MYLLCLRMRVVYTVYTTVFTVFTYLCTVLYGMDMDLERYKVSAMLYKVFVFHKGTSPNQSGNR